ncbi:MAG: hypothetical protein SFU53_15345 [Terrimicrobiaceae bacterium]|nr:hypothetical protein [Terrimicrobiaceae bacterium]
MRPIAAILCLFAAVSGVSAGTSSKSFKQSAEVEHCHFRDFELQLDGFGAFLANPEFETHGRTLNTGVGGGTAINFFFFRYFGIGAEALWYGNGGSAEHMINGNAFFRYPICRWNLAPYIMVGGGSGWDHVNVGYVSVGGGMEWRFHRHFGLFSDGRAFLGAPDVLGVTRVGFRIVF